MSRSLSGRMLIWATALMLVFFSVTVVVLNTIFKDLASRAMRDRLDGQLVALIAASESVASGGLRPVTPLANPRFNTPDSGLYGEIRDPAGHTVWRSDSALGIPLLPAEASLPGLKVFQFRVASDGSEWAQMRLTVNWELEQKSGKRYTFAAVEDTRPYRAQIRQFRVQLLGWFGGLALLLSAAIAALLRRGLAPLRQLQSEILDVERGDASALSTGYPRELAGVALNLNTLLASERSRADRYRQTLGNLAHEIKTPLAVLRAQLSRLPAADRASLDEPIGRMDQIVVHQLRRARISAGATLGQVPLDVAQLLQELVQTMRKVYADKAISVTLNVVAASRFAGDRGDLLELFGNLLDNACKWARSQVCISIDAVAAERLRPAQCRVIIEDDGPGWGSEEPESLFTRGVRADETAPGHGLGLSIVRELVDAYDGEIRAGRAALGGARIEVRLPIAKDRADAER
jgi:two-component system, OmpR family, sensor histidine kinase PhoQ